MKRTAGVPLLALFVLLVSGAAPLHGQHRSGATRFDPLAGTPSGPTATGDLLLSLAVPGLAQARNGELRWVGYAAAEIAAWGLWLDRRDRGGDFREAYRDLAWTTARGGSGRREDGDFRFYEHLLRWGSSGDWDADGAAGLQPEPDAGTYNGMIWQRARDLHVAGRPGPLDPEDPAWQRALAYYQDHAYGPAFLWDWPDRESRERYGSLIDASDDHYRQATLMIGIVLMNHLLSGADAFVSARLAPSEQTGGASGAVRLELRWIP